MDCSSVRLLIASKSIIFSLQCYKKQNNRSYIVTNMKAFAVIYPKQFPFHYKELAVRKKQHIEAPLNVTLVQPLPMWKNQVHLIERHHNLSLQNHLLTRTRKMKINSQNIKQEQDTGIKSIFRSSRRNQAQSMLIGQKSIVEGSPSKNRSPIFKQTVRQPIKKLQQSIFEGASSTQSDRIFIEPSEISIYSEEQLAKLKNEPIKYRKQENTIVESQIVYGKSYGEMSNDVYYESQSQNMSHNVPIFNTNRHNKKSQRVDRQTTDFVLDIEEYQARDRQRQMRNTLENNKQIDGKKNKGETQILSRSLNLKKQIFSKKNKQYHQMQEIKQKRHIKTEAHELIGQKKRSFNLTMNKTQQVVINSNRKDELEANEGFESKSSDSGIERKNIESGRNIQKKRESKKYVDSSPSLSEIEAKSNIRQNISGSSKIKEEITSNRNGQDSNQQYGYKLQNSIKPKQNSRDVLYNEEETPKNFKKIKGLGKNAIHKKDYAWQKTAKYEREQPTRFMGKQQSNIDIQSNSNRNIGLEDSYRSQAVSNEYRILHLRPKSSKSSSRSILNGYLDQSQKGSEISISVIEIKNMAPFII